MQDGDVPVPAADVEDLMIPGGPSGQPGSDAARALSSDHGDSVAGYLLLALLSLAAGMVALLWPGLTQDMVFSCLDRT